MPLPITSELHADSQESQEPHDPGNHDAVRAASTGTAFPEASPSDIEDLAPPTPTNPFAPLPVPSPPSSPAACQGPRAAQAAAQPADPSCLGAERAVHAGHVVQQAGSTDAAEACSAADVASPGAGAESGALAGCGEQVECVQDVIEALVTAGRVMHEVESPQQPNKSAHLPSPHKQHIHVLPRHLLYKNHVVLFTVIVTIIYYYYHYYSSSSSSQFYIYFVQVMSVLLDKCSTQTCSGTHVLLLNELHMNRVPLWPRVGPQDVNEYVKTAAFHGVNERHARHRQQHHTNLNSSVPWL